MSSKGHRRREECSIFRAIERDTHVLLLQHVVIPLPPLPFFPARPAGQKHDGWMGNQSLPPSNFGKPMI